MQGDAHAGATVKHSCSQSSEQQIVIDIKAGSPSNISVFPQPGLAANMAAAGLDADVLKGIAAQHAQLRAAALVGAQTALGELAAASGRD